MQNRKPRKKFTFEIITRIWLHRIFTILISILLVIIFISKNSSSTITTETHGTQDFIPQILLFLLAPCIPTTYFSFRCPDLLVDKSHAEYETVNAVVVDEGFSDYSDKISSSDPYVVLLYDGFQRKVHSRRMYILYNIGDTAEMKMVYGHDSEGNLSYQYFAPPE